MFSETKRPLEQAMCNMKTKWMFSIRSFGVLIIAASANFSCGGDDLQCGPNTAKQGGKCISTIDPVECGEGTTLNPETGQCDSDTQCASGTTYDPVTGLCEPDAECGEGTTLNPQTGLCEPDSVCGPDTTWNAETGECEPNVVCGPDTSLVDGECVPDPKCGVGTHYDAAIGQCVPDLVCGEGLTAFDDVCMTPSEIVAAEADQTESLPDANDPAFEGTPELIVLEPQGEKVVFTGTIERPVDRDEDGDVDQDIDVWSFAGLAGQLLHIRVLDNGLPQPSFLLHGPEGYSRSSAVGVSTGADRYVVLPYDGLYELSIIPANIRIGGAPLGGETHEYVGVVEEIAWPTPIPIEVPAADQPAVTKSGSLQGIGDNFFQLVTGAGTTVLADASSQGAQNIPVLLVFKSDGSFVGAVEYAEVTGLPAGSWCDGDKLECDGGNYRCDGEEPLFKMGLCEPSSSSPDPLDDVFKTLSGLYSSSADELVLVVDWIWSAGPDQPFELTVSGAAGQSVGDVGIDVTVESEVVTVPSRSAVSMSFGVTMGQVITTYISGAAERTLLGPNGVIEAGVSSTRYDFYAATSGPYTWVLVNESEQAADYQLTAFSQTPFDAGFETFDATAPLQASYSVDELRHNRYIGESRWILVANSAPGLLETEWSYLTGIPELNIYSVDESGRLEDERRANEDDLPLLGALLEEPQLSLVKLENTLGGKSPDPVILGWTVDLELSPVPTDAEAEPNDTFADAIDLGAIDGTSPYRLIGENENNVDEDDYYTFSIDPPLQTGEVMVVRVENIDGSSAPRLFFFDASENPLYPLPSDTSALTNDTIVAWPLTADDGPQPYYLQIEATSTSGPARYVLEMRRKSIEWEVEPNDSIAAAMDLGELILPYSVEGRCGGGSSSTGDVDVFSFSLPAGMSAEEGVLIRLENLLDSSDLEPVLYDTNGATTLLHDEVPDRVWAFNPATSGPYYVRVRTDSTYTSSSRDRKWYRLSFSALPSVETESNNLVSSANQLPAIATGESVAVWGTDDEGGSDYFEIQLTDPLAADEVLSVRWNHYDRRGDIQVHCYDTAGELVFSSELYAGEQVHAPVGESGPFYVQVVPDHSSSSYTPKLQTYRLEVARLAGLVGEQEPNDDQATAQSVDLPAHIRAQSIDETSQEPADPDFYRFTLPRDLTGAEAVRISATVPLAAVDLIVKVYDETFTEVAAVQGPDPVLDYVPAVPTSGTQFYVLFQSTSSSRGEFLVYDAAIDIISP